MNPWLWLQERLSAHHVPTDLREQAPSLAPELPYETVVGGYDRPVVLGADGRIGVVWRLRLVPHEVLRNDQVRAATEGVAQVLATVLTEADQVAQLLFDAEPAWRIERPTWQGLPTAAQEVVEARVRHVEALAAGQVLGRQAFRTMRHELHLTLSMKGHEPALGWRAALQSLALGREGSEEAASKAFHANILSLIDAAVRLEDGLDAVGLAPEVCGGGEVLRLLRRAWHDEEQLQNDPSVSMPYDADRRLGDQVARGAVRANRAGVQVGQDTWQVLSWMEQPQHVRFGLFHLLLGYGVPLRCVLNIRPALDRSDLDIAKAQLSAPLLRSERKTRHLEELRHVEERLVHGESLLSVAMHVAVKSEGVPLERLLEEGRARGIGYHLAQSTDMDVVLEESATLALYRLMQPLAYTPGAAWFTGRELRVLTSALGPYLPIFGGFPGQHRARHRVQLMHARAGSPVWLAPRASETAPHTAVLASTGAGKSFYLANLLCAEAAANPDALFFVIDSLTSYRVLGEVLGAEEGENTGLELVQPPASMPNVWAGRLTAERLGVLVGLLRAAMTLVDPAFVVRNEHAALLEGAIRKAFADRMLDSETLWAGTGKDRRKVFGAYVQDTTRSRPLPRLSDVVANFAAVAAEEGFGDEAVVELTRQMSSFVGRGRYASFFDVKATAPPSDPTPKVTLYDFGSIEDPVVRSLTLFICVAEVVRQVMRPENRGKPGVMLVDEAGVLLSQEGEAGRELVAFVKTAWKTFRKLGVACIGSTNEPADYSEKAGPRTIWANSPNKVFLRLKPDDLRLARLGNVAEGRPPLIDDELLGELAVSLRKVDGVYSQGLWVSDEDRGTFTYIPSGYDYWLAASKPIEVANFLAVSATLGAREGLHWLAEHHPGGVRTEDGVVRALLSDEVPEKGRPRMDPDDEATEHFSRYQLDLPGEAELLAEVST